MNSGRSPLPFNPWPEPLARRYRDKGYWLDVPLTAILHEHRHSTDTAILCGARCVSYRDLDQASANLARHLRNRGLNPGDTALVQLPNVAEFYIVFFALLKAGIVPVNALFSHQALELRDYVRQVRPQLLIAARRHPLFADDHFSQTLAIDTQLFLGDNLETAIASNSPADTDLMPTNAGEVAFFQLSGGSTGTPKLIPRTHNDYFYSVRRSVEICQLTAETRYLVALPAGHNFALSSPGALGVLAAGGRLVMAESPEPCACFQLLHQHQVTHTALVPSAVLLWLARAQTHRAQLRSLSLLQVGGANFSEATARRVTAELGCKLQQVFGMAEGLVNYTRLDDDPETVVTCQGRPMSPDDEIKVIDRAGNPVAPGETGQLITRGPYTFRGYFQAPEYNQRVFDREGFYYTGDLVQQMANGYLKVVGRVKDQINRGGEKIAAEEIESLLLRHPNIVDAALIAIPDDALGEKSCACLITDGAPIKPLVVRKFLRSQGVADYKLPDAVTLLTEFPLTPVGKTNKKALRAQLNVATGV